MDAIARADFEMDPAYQMEIIRGADPAQESLFLEVFGTDTVRTMSGKIPFIPDKYTMLSGEANTKVGHTDKPTEFEMENSSADFSFDYKYAKKGSIPKYQVRTLERLRGAEDLVGYLGAIAEGMIWDAFDRDGSTILKSQTLNQTVAAQAQWDSGNEDPAQDFWNAEDALGDGDLICWIGLNKMRELQQSEAYAASINNYSGTNSIIPMQTVVDQIRTNHAFSQVIVGRRWYHADDVRADLSRNRIFDDVVWVGTRDHILPLERPDLMEVDNAYDSETQVYSQHVIKYLDIARANTEKGVVITGT